MGYVDTTAEHRLAINGDEEFVSRSTSRVYRRHRCICGFHTPWVRQGWLAALLFEKHVIRETQVTMSREEVQRRLAAIKAKQEEPPF